PNDIWDITETPIKDADGTPELPDLKIILRRPITMADWERFLFYSHRVKSFNVDEDGALENLEVYDTLDLSFPEEYLFPNLKKLKYWLLDAADSFHHIRLFLTPSLTTLHMAIDNISHLPIFSTLAPKCTRLTYFSLGTSGILDVAAIPAISRFLWTLHRVESLVVTGLDEAALCHIARLPGLRSLWLMSPEAPIPFSQILEGSLHFPALTSLECETMERAPALLGTSIKCSLVEFSLFLRGLSVPPSKITVGQFYSALATYCSHASLRKLSVEGGYLDPNTIQLDIYLVGGEMLKPLFSFSNLIKVSLSHPAGLDLDDAVVGDMACAWPRIESLLLPPGRSHRITTRVTLEGVYAFAKHCPCLQVLSMAFDATDVPEIKIKAKNRVSQNSLDRLEVGSSLIGAPRPVAEFLSTIFPALKTVDTFHRQLSPNPQVVASHEGWKQVKAALLSGSPPPALNSGIDSARKS
ncbi:hypothetical protein C8R44DRAFT_930748, partial [Mycena epipterygia]